MSSSQEGEIPYVNPLLQGYFDRFLQMQAGEMAHTLQLPELA